MKIKLQNLILLAFTLSLTACGVKLFNASESAQAEKEDITRPPKVVASKKQDVRVRSNPDEAVSYEEWKKQNEIPAKDADK